MRVWIDSADGGKAKYAAIEKPYIHLLDLLDARSDDLRTTVAQPGDAGRKLFIAFLQAAFSDLRRACLMLTTASDDDALDGGVARVLSEVLADEQATHWLDDDLAGIPWAGQFAGKTYERCLKIARLVGPLYARGYHPDRAFVGKGSMPRRGAPKTGDKLHLSVDSYSFKVARDSVLPFIAQSGHVHKIVADVEDLQGDQAGKVVTIFPKLVSTDDGLAVDGAELAAFADALAAFASGLGMLPGPAVRNETPWKGSSFVYLEKDAKLVG
jgi:hypothetical protein